MNHTQPRFRLGDALRVARKESGMEQADIADALNVSRATISKWENGKSHPPFWAVVEWAMLTDTDLEFFVAVRPSGQGRSPTKCYDASPAIPVNDDQLALAV